MIDNVAGVTAIRMLYVQLLYRCNFSCQHCFHGELLAAPDQYTSAEVLALLRHFRENYKLQAVTLLGGEPLLHPEIGTICRDAKELGLSVEICTNGHFGFRNQLQEIAPYVDKLRVSLEGLGETNDRIRHAGGFDSALRTIDFARSLGIDVGATMTITAPNIAEVVPLARLIEKHGVAELKLHCLRLVGNANNNPTLAVPDQLLYARLHRDIRDANLGIQVIYDSDLSSGLEGENCAMPSEARELLDRIEVDPRGALTMSCKAVGLHANAFQWDKHSATILHTPHTGDEMSLRIADVIYRPA